MISLHFQTLQNNVINPIPDEQALRRTAALESQQQILTEELTKLQNISANLAMRLDLEAERWR